MTARIKREETRNGDQIAYIHSFCTDCSYWYAFAWTRDEAYGQAERHLMNVHDIESNAAQAARHKAAQRARERADTPTIAG